MASGTATPSMPIRSSTCQPQLRPNRRRREVRPKSQRDTTPSPRDNATKGGKARIAALAAVIGVIVLIAGSVLYFTDGFGIWTRPGPIVKPVSATVFSPDGAPDNPQKAGLAIDGNPDTGWSTVAYEDAVPFPNFIEGMGLLLHLAEPTALSAVTHRRVQHRNPGADPLVAHRHPRQIVRHHRADPDHVTAARAQPIEVHDRTKTSNVLVWISTLGTTDGKSRMKISEITLQASA